MTPLAHRGLVHFNGDAIFVLLLGRLQRISRPGFRQALPVEHRDNEFARQGNHINALRASGASQNDAWQSSAECPDTPSTSISKRQNSVLIIETNLLSGIGQSPEVDRRVALQDHMA